MQQVQIADLYTIFTQNKKKKFWHPVFHGSFLHYTFVTTHDIDGTYFLPYKNLPLVEEIQPKDINVDVVRWQKKSVVAFSRFLQEQLHL